MQNGCSPSARVPRRSCTGPAKDGSSLSHPSRAAYTVRMTPPPVSDVTAYAEERRLPPSVTQTAYFLLGATRSNREVAPLETRFLPRRRRVALVRRRWTPALLPAAGLVCRRVLNRRADRGRTGARVHAVSLQPLAACPSRASLWRSHLVRRSSSSLGAHRRDRTLVSLRHSRRLLHRSCLRARRLAAHRQRPRFVGGAPNVGL